MSEQLTDVIVEARVRSLNEKDTIIFVSVDHHSPNSRFFFGTQSELQKIYKAKNVEAPYYVGGFVNGTWNNKFWDEYVVARWLGEQEK